VRVPRYRELYALPLPDASLNRLSPADDTSDLDGEAADEELQDVLARFQRHEEDHQRRTAPRPVSRHASLELDRRGFVQNVEASKSRVTFADDAASERSFYPDDHETAGRKTMYFFDHPNGSRPSVYSRYEDFSDEEGGERRSFMDPGKSEQARKRFLKRISDMYDPNGREREIPPVPQLRPARSVPKMAPQPQHSDWL
jgi:hypothetical protein